MPDRPDETCVRHEGPWTHRMIDANGSRFHVVEAGTGPLVLLLHGFPEYWWTWRHQIAPLADAGYRVVAVDLRGYGASDKPPRGYDGYTLSGDIAALIRSLGERDAAVVGHDWGGHLAWTTAAFHPRMVRRLAVLAMPHPLRLRNALLTDRAQIRASAYIGAFQTPRFEHHVTRDRAAYVGGLLRRWSGPAWTHTTDFAEYERACRTAIRIPQAAFCAMEYYRWAVRSTTRPSGWRFNRLLAAPIAAPVLQLHGALDSCLLPGTAAGSGRYVAGRYEWVMLGGVGHFPQAEAPAAVTGELVRWLKDD
jgi:pimeloyl-ACP methyl ester carboxylesterase